MIVHEKENRPVGVVGTTRPPSQMTAEHWAEIQKVQNEIARGDYWMNFSSDRPELQQALRYATDQDCTLCAIRVHVCPRYSLFELDK